MPSIHSVESLARAYNKDGDIKHLLPMLMKFGQIHMKFLNPKLIPEIRITDGFVDVRELVSLDSNLVRSRLYEEKKVIYEPSDEDEPRYHHKPGKDRDYDYD